MRFYRGSARHTPQGGMYVFKGVSKDGEVIAEYVFDPKASQKVCNHSPDGFNWGYGGSGPAQLALALLLDAMPELSQTTILMLCSQFKWDFVAQWPQDEPWIITEQKIRDWVAQELSKYPVGVKA